MIWGAIIVAWMAGSWVSSCLWHARVSWALHPWRIYVALLLVVLTFVMGARAHAATVPVPDVDARLRLLVEQSVADEWGVDGSPALLAAQLHQESSWNTHARSPAGAEGLAQMMPATGRWLASLFPQLGAYDPWDPAWSARAAAVYDHWLLVRNPGLGECSNWAFALSAYNGGETLLHREQHLAATDGRQPLRWFGNTADYRARSLPAWQQNRQYVQHILLVLEPAYVANGWSGQVLCT